MCRTCNKVRKKILKNEPVKYNINKGNMKKAPKNEPVQ